MRILIGGMSHESNTLNPIITGESDFKIHYGDEVLGADVSPDYSISGVIAELQKAGCDLVTTVYARAVPNGLVSAPLYARLKEEMVARIRRALAEGPLDGVCLALHGSMKIEGLGCAEGDLLTAVRSVVPDLPLTVALDMHATMTDSMLAACDGIVGYKTAPHVDCKETGEHAARMLLARLNEGKKLVTRMHSVPVLIAGEKSESEAQPMADLIAELREVEKLPGVAAASLFLGFPWADDANEAVATVVTTYGDPVLAEALTARLARSFWARRKDFAFRVEHYDSQRSLAVAYEAVLKGGLKPVFVSDSGDNPTAGSTGDSTELFEKVLATLDTVDRLPTPLVYSGFYDVAATSACVTAGEGSLVKLTIGGTWDKVNGRPIPLEVKVLKVVRHFGPYDSDLVLVAYRNLRITLTSKHIGFGDPDLLPAVGVDAQAHCLVVVKLGYLEPCFRTIAARAILATSKGCSNEVLESIPYQNVRRPLYPLDPAMTCDLD